MHVLTRTYVTHIKNLYISARCADIMNYVLTRAKL